ncbi:MAG: DUF2232 domain-containing protein [Oligoflexia bacterium]|nr:DUF2232 domain-containing protein [Oligoflexia bacterium]
MISDGGRSGLRRRRSPPALLRILPFFLSALFFLSAFFAIFSPLPILLLAFRDYLPKYRPLPWLALLTNAALVYGVAGGASLLIYAVFIAAPTLVLIEVLRRNQSIERAAVGALVAIVLAGAVALGGYSRVRRENPVAQIRQAMSSAIDQLAASLQQANSSKDSSEVLEPADIEEWKQDAWVELPSAAAIIALVLVCVNLLLLVRMSPRDLRERLKIDSAYFLRWRAPDWLVWPTIASGVTVLFDLGLASEIGQNLFKFLMAIYALQGLSVMAFFFRYWKLARLLQVVGYIVAILLVMPLLLSIGFFDLWFDFRAKFRQT